MLQACARTEGRETRIDNVTTAQERDDSAVDKNQKLPK
jgi:hypothetical protein